MSIATPAARTVMLVALAMMALHVITTWGYLSLFWGDNGRWLYEVDRVAHGATIYRDVYWAFPPVAMWLVGGITRVIGSELTQIWMVTASVALAIAAAYAAFVTRLLPRRLALPATVAGLALGLAFSQQLSAPLALGMYSPAVPIAFLVLLLQLLAFLGDWDRPTVRGALVVGMLGGLGFLTKHDVWFSCAALTAAAGLLTPSAGGLRRAVAAAGGFGLVAGSGLAVLASMHGVSALRDIFTGYGHVDEFSGINLPDLAMATVELAAFGAVLATTAFVGRVSGAWRGRSVGIAFAGGIVLAGTAAAIWLWRSDVTAQAILLHGKPAMTTPFEGLLLPVEGDQLTRLRRAFGVLRLQLLRHMIPLLVPLAVLLVAIARRRAVADSRRWLLLIVLLVVALALRGRRMIAFTEWSGLLLELPVYAFALTTLWQLTEVRVVRAVRLATIVFVLFALYANWRFGYGVGSRRGVFPAVATARGPVRIGPGLAKDLNYVRDLAQRIDPTGSRPIFAFGYSAGFSYLLGRPSVGSMTQGFRLSLYPSPDSAFQVAMAQRERLILVDNPAYVDAVPSAAFTPWRWQPVMQQNSYLRDDRPLFERLKAGCTQVTEPGRTSMFTVYDCAPGAARGS